MILDSNFRKITAACLPRLAIVKVLQDIASEGTGVQCSDNLGQFILFKMKKDQAGWTFKSIRSEIKC